jgi:transposase
MAWTPPIPEPLWKTASPEVQAAILALVEFYEQRLAKLEARVNDLENRLKLNSTNSSKTPSSDPIGMKRKPPGFSQRKETGRAALTSQSPPCIGPTPKDS